MRPAIGAIDRDMVNHHSRLQGVVPVSPSKVTDHRKQKKQKKRN